MRFVKILAAIAACFIANLASAQSSNVSSLFPSSLSAQELVERAEFMLARGVQVTIFDLHCSKLPQILVDRNKEAGAEAILQLSGIGDGDFLKGYLAGVQRTQGLLLALNKSEYCNLSARAVSSAADEYGLMHTLQ